jgi:rubrerythrin
MDAAGEGTIRDEIRCESCGYGAVVSRRPQRCPMCGDQSWIVVGPDAAVQSTQS